MNIPKVSILLPTHNGAKWIGGAIESVLHQTYPHFELIVINDASADNTESVVRDFVHKDARVVYVANETNLGIQKTLNKGLQLAKGEYIARIDDDDVWAEKDKLEKQVSFLDMHHDYALVGTGTIVVNEEGTELFRFLSPETDEEVRNKLLFKNCFTHSSVMFRKDVVLSGGGYREDEVARHVEDYELWLRLGVKGKLGNLPMYGVRFMLRGGAISARYKPAQLKNTIRLIQMYKRYYYRSFLAVVFAHIRYTGYVLLEKLPKPFQKFVFGIYKKF